MKCIKTAAYKTKGGSRAAGVFFDDFGGFCFGNRRAFSDHVLWGLFSFVLLSLGVDVVVIGSALRLLIRVLTSCVLPRLGPVSYGLYLAHRLLCMMVLQHAEVLVPGHQGTSVTFHVLAT